MHHWVYESDEDVRERMKEKGGPRAYMGVCKKCSTKAPEIILARDLEALLDDYKWGHVALTNKGQVWRMRRHAVKPLS